MGPVEWYYARGEKQQGPVPSAELKRLAAAGQLRPDDLVWREGLAEWTAARNVQGLFEELARPAAAGTAGVKGISIPPQVVTPPAGPAPVPAAAQPAARPLATLWGGRHFFDVLLDYLRQLIPSRFVEATAQVMERVGRIGLLAGMGLCLLFGLTVSIQNNQMIAVIVGIMVFLTLAVLQYGAGKFCAALERLNHTTTYVVCSTAFLDWSALLFLLTAVGVLLGTIVAALEAERPMFFLYGLGGFVVCLYLAMIALRPESIQISVSPEIRAGEEAIGVFSFALKSLVRLTPVLFGTGVAVGCLSMAYTCVLLFVKSTLDAVSGAGPAQSILLYSAVLPIAAYLLFLLYVLLVEVCRALLVLPGKLDKISGEEEEGESNNPPDSESPR
ncbi:MAG: DUF4339 domain-containing protein [Pirellulales bacterium]|nr:DUF4339 domain-containing protein [Pirellulales bacterium]